MEKAGKRLITKEGHGERNRRVNHTKHTGKIGFFRFLEEFFHN